MIEHAISTVHVSRSEAYDIVLGYQNLSQFPAYLKSCIKGKRIVIVTHPSLLLYATPLKEVLLSVGYSVFILEVPEGEGSKQLSQVDLLLTSLLRLKLDRHDSLIALGGGVIGDLTGFVASLYLRGIAVIQMPTTVLSQVDSSIGGKTGVNHALGKNLIGSFYQPRLVWIDLHYLETLSLRERRSGLAEVVKYGIIRDPDLFVLIESHSDVLMTDSISVQLPLWTEIITRSCVAKSEIVTEDEKESGIRAHLNFGHTIGHGVEAAYDYGTFLHGEAVAVGMISALYMAVELKMVAKDLYDRVLRVLGALGFPLHVSGLSVADIFTPMSLDKKIKDNKLCFVLPTALGTVILRNDISSELVQAAIHHILKETR